MFNPLKKTVTIETLAKVVIQYVIMQCKGILLEYLLTLGNLSVKNLCFKVKISFKLNDFFHPKKCIVERKLEFALY